MNTTHRDFLKSSAAFTALGLSGLPGFEQSAEQAPAPLDILILGGTGFLGPPTDDGE